MATSVQAAATSASGRDVVLDEDPPVAGQREDRRQGLGPLLGGEGVVGVAEDVERLAADDGRRERRRVGRGAAEVDQPPARRHGPAGRLGHPAEHRVDDHVGRSFQRVGHRGGQLGDIAGLRQRDHGMGPVAAGSLDTAGAAHGHDPARALGGGDPDSGLADRTTGAEHEHPLAGLHARPQVQRGPRRHTRQPEGRGHRVVDAVRQGHHVGLRDRAPLAEGAVAGLHAGRRRDPHAPAGVGDADSLHARDVRQRGRAEVRRARRTQQVQRDDGRRGDPDQHLALGGRRIGVLGVRRRLTVGGQDGGPHVASIKLRCPGRGARCAPWPCRRRSGTPADRGRARTSR